MLFKPGITPGSRTTDFYSPFQNYNSEYPDTDQFSTLESDEKDRRYQV